MATPVSLAEARSLVAAGLPRPAPELVALEAALGRTTAHVVLAPNPLPGFDNSAMDGWAVRAVDTPGELRIVGESSAGHPAERRIGAGEAIRVSTGAMLPEGADAVARLEVCDGSVRGREGVEAGGDGSVRVLERVSGGRDVRRRAEEVAAGAPLVGAGVCLGPVEVGALAAAGLRALECDARLRVAIVVTGDELGGSADAGGLPDSNRAMLAALARADGAEVVATATVGDDAAAITAAIAAGLEAADLVVTSGGMSVGPHDHVRVALETAGVRLAFAGVALAPGRPASFGVHPSGAAVLGLPGNPLSALVAYHLLAADRRHATVPAAAPLAARPGRTRAIPVRLGRDGAEPLGDAGHGPTAALGADGLALVDRDVMAGEPVAVALL